jgi:hypothetical protein
MSYAGALLDAMLPDKKIESGQGVLRRGCWNADHLFESDIIVAAK